MKRRFKGAVVARRVLPHLRIARLCRTRLAIAHGTVLVAGSVSGFASRDRLRAEAPNSATTRYCRSANPCLRRCTPNLAGRLVRLSPQPGDLMGLTLNL